MTEHHHEHTHEHLHEHEVNVTPSHLHIYVKAWLITFVIAGLELAGSIFSGSFALLADITHVFTDTIVGLAPVSVEVMKRRTIISKERIEATGGILISIFLIFVGYHIISEANERLMNGSMEAVSGLLMFMFSGLAALGNLYQHRLLSRISPMHRHAAHSGFHFHILTDLVKNLILPFLGLWIYLGGPQSIDAYAGYAIGWLIIMRALLLVLESIFGKHIVQHGLDRFIHWIIR